MVAARAGATPPAVYRRFPTNIELVYQAVLPTLPTAELAIVGDLESAVRALIRASIDLFSRPAVHTAISEIVAEIPSEPGLSARPLGRFQDNTYVLLQQFLDTAAAEGRAVGGVDARLLVDMISGTVMMSLANERHLDDAWVDQTTALIVKGNRAVSEAESGSVPMEMAASAPAQMGLRDIGDPGVTCRTHRLRCHPCLRDHP